MNITTGQGNHFDRKLVEFQDVTHVPVCADGGLGARWLGIATMAYPDICCAECGGIKGIAWGGTIDDRCQFPLGSCDEECFAMHANHLWAEDPKARAATARHLGGTNIGWADGHATWMHAQALIAMSDEGEIEGAGWTCTGPPGADWGGSNPVSYQANCGPLESGLTFLHNEPIDDEGNRYNF